MVFRKPEQGVGKEKIPHLIPAEIKNVGSPIGVLPLAGIEVFIKGRSVKASEGEFILGKMGWDPVQNHPDAFLVQVIHQVFKIIRRPKACGRREVG